MKGPVVFGLSLCIVFALCFADEDDHQELREVLHCVACAAPGSDIRAEYKTCAAHKPARLVKLLKECCMETMPDATDENAVWEKICEDATVLDKIHECAKSKKGDLEPTEEEKRQCEEYEKCAKAIEGCH